MRIMLLALMMVILPLRGWTGNAMAVDMASQAVAFAQQTSASTPGSAERVAAEAMPSDCPMLGQTAGTATADADSPASGDHCKACDTCELCLAMATSGESGRTACVFQRQVAPLASGHCFSSADNFSRFKPPISWS
jgi:hypothetical protein